MEPLCLPCVFPCGFWVFPCGSAGKESACNAGDLGLIPGLGKIPWRTVFWPGEFHGLYSSWGRRDLDTTERRSLTALHFCVCSLCVSIKCSQVQMLPRDTRWLLAVHSPVGWDAQVLCCWGFCLRGQGRGNYVMRSVGGVGSGSWEHRWDLKELADPTHSAEAREFFPFHVPQKLCMICLLISWVMLSFFLLLPCTALPPTLCPSVSTDRSPLLSPHLSSSFWLTFRPQPSVTSAGGRGIFWTASHPCSICVSFITLIKVCHLGPVWLLDHHLPRTVGFRGKAHVAVGLQCGAVGYLWFEWFES